MTDPAQKLRWYRLTPDHFVIGLLVVEGLLWLSERFQWFWFNEKKGWTVLSAMAAVGVTMLVMLLWFVASLIFRWRFQFLIRSLLVLTIAVAVPCSWLAVEMKKARRQKAVVERLVTTGYAVLYDYQKRPGTFNYSNTVAFPCPSFLRKVFGDDFFADVHFLSGTVTDTHSVCIEELRELRGFSGTLTDGGMSHLATLSKLKLLDLKKSQITNKGLVHLQNLTNIESLFLTDNSISGAGLMHITHMRKLRHLSLQGNPITDDGLVYIVNLKNLQMLGLGYTQVTDTGLDHLKSLTNLNCLGLWGSKVTKKGAENIKKALPDCEVDLPSQRN